jgi:hypothetical protein
MRAFAAGALVVAVAFEQFERRTGTPASLARLLRCSSAPPRSSQSTCCSSAMPARKPPVSPSSRR